MRFYFRCVRMVAPAAMLAHVAFLGSSWSHPDEKFEVKGNSPTTRLTRSKTIGSDKTVSSRSVVVSPTCFVKRSEWLSCGWALLKQQADYPRDYLLPVPSGNYKGCVRRELRYDTAHALQTKVLQSLKVRGEPLLSQRTAQYWTSLRPKLLGQRGVSSRGLETGQRHARRMGGTGK